MCARPIALRQVALPEGSSLSDLVTYSRLRATVSLAFASCRTSARHPGCTSGLPGSVSLDTPVGMDHLVPTAHYRRVCHMRPKAACGCGDEALNPPIGAKMPSSEQDRRETETATPVEDRPGASRGVVGFEVRRVVVK